MNVYPHNLPIVMDDATFVEYGGKKGTFSAKQLLSSYWVAEVQVSRYIGTLLLPTDVTGTFPYMGMKRVITDYGYVSKINAVSILTVNGLSQSCDLLINSGCAFIYEDTFGYLDIRQVLSANQAGIVAFFPIAFPAFPTFYYPLANFLTPYQFQIAYTAGLPTGVATQPGILEALTIVAQIDLNEKDPGNSGMNEGVGNVGIEEFSDGGIRGYREKRKTSNMRNTILGSSPKSMYAARLLDMSIKKARPLLRM